MSFSSLDGWAFAFVILTALIIGLAAAALIWEALKSAIIERSAAFQISIIAVLALVGSSYIRISADIDAEWFNEILQSRLEEDRELKSHEHDDRQLLASLTATDLTPQVRSVLQELGRPIPEN